MPASSRWLSTLSEISDALPLTMLMTPGGIPASSSSSIRKWLTSSVCVAGLNTTVLPMSIGAVGRLPAIEVKLKGLTAKTKPSSGRYSRRFQAVPSLYGWLRSSSSPKKALKRQKSIVSHAASISAWCTVLDWPSMVAALIVSRHGPARSDAARSKTAARSWYEVAAHIFRAASAALMASSMSLAPPTAYSAIASSWRWGERMSAREAPHRRSPPICIGTSVRASVSSARRDFRLLRCVSVGE